MIAPSQRKTSIANADTARAQPEAALPPFRHLVSVAAVTNAPLVGIALCVGHIGWALGLLGGMVISLAVCGLLHVIVTQVMPYLVASLRGQPIGQAKTGAMLQFAAVLVAKFLILAVVGYVILTVRAVNWAGVVIGFLLTQGAIVVTVGRRLNSR